MKSLVTIKESFKKAEIIRSTCRLFLTIHSTKNNKMGKIWEKHFLKETNYQTDYNPPVLRQMNNNDQ